MEKSVSCIISQLINTQLNPSYATGESGGSPTANDVFNMLPYMAIPLLLVLIAGLYFISLYRKKGVQP